MSGQFVGLLLLVLVVTAHDEIHRQFSRTSMSHGNINYLPRQIATATSSSSVNWVNPAMGITTAAPASNLPSSSNSIAGILNTIVSSPAPAPSTSIIHITAIPPSTSAAVPVPLRYHKKNNRISNFIESLLRPFILIPISAFLGFVQGIISTWSYLKLRKRCRRNKDVRVWSTSLEPGPPYTAIRPRTPKYNKEFQMGRSPTTVTPFDGGSPSKYSVHGSVYHSSRGGSWLERATSGHSRQSDTCGVGEKAFLWPPQPFSAQTRDNEDDPFLVPPSRCASTRTAATKMSFRSAKEEQILPYDVSAQKRYRRGLLEHLKLGTMSRGQRPPALSPNRGEYEEVQLTKEPVSAHTPNGISPITRGGTRTTQYSRRREGHRRSDSDVSISEVRRPERTYSPAASPTKARSVVKSVKDETEWVAGHGFRLVEEDAPCGPPSAQLSKVQESSRKEIPRLGNGRSNFANERPSSQTKEPVGGWLFGIDSSAALSSQSVDMGQYTVLPVHKTITKSKDGPNTPILPRCAQSSKLKPSHLSHDVSTVLPLSLPPSFPSPLESQLLFCSPFIPPSHSIPRTFPLECSISDGANSIATTTPNNVYSLTSLPLPSSPYRQPFVPDLITNNHPIPSPYTIQSGLPRRSLEPTQRLESSSQYIKHGRGIPGARSPARPDTFNKIRS